MGNGIDNLNLKFGDKFLGFKCMSIVKSIFLVSSIAALAVAGALVNNMVEQADVYVDMHMMHMELHSSSEKMWSVYEAYTEALQTAASAQPEDGAPLSPEIMEIIWQQKSLLEKYAKNTEAEFKEWEKFDVGHFEGEILEGKRRLNAYYAGVIRDSLVDAQKSAQLAYEDIPKGPNSAVLVKVAAQDFSKISSYQTEAWAVRERTGRMNLGELLGKLARKIFLSSAQLLR